MGINVVEYKLSFCKLIILDSNLIEVIVNEGIEVTLDMVGEYHDFLIEKMPALFLVLINTINSHTLTFDAQRYMNALEGIHSVAIIIYTKQSEMANKYQSKIGIRKSQRISLFTNKEEALNWLYLQFNFK